MCQYTSQALTGIKFSIVCAKQIGGNFFIGQASVCIIFRIRKIDHNNKCSDIACRRQNI